MSHIVSIESKIHDPVAVTAACQRLSLPPPVHGTVELFSGQATGLLVKLPDWQYPAVIDPLSGTIKYDNYGGAWGDEVHLHLFMQSYAIEKTKLEGRKRGHTVTEQQLEGGFVKVQVIEAA